MEYAQYLSLATRTNDLAGLWKRGDLASASKYLTVLLGAMFCQYCAEHPEYTAPAFNRDLAERAAIEFIEVSNGGHCDWLA